MNAAQAQLIQKVLGVSVLVAGLMSAVVGPVAAASTAPIAATATLSAAEAAGLIFMREEEKLAHDVYVTFYQQSGLAIFNNIANSEATHMASIKTLLDRYGLVDPVAGHGVGEFENADLQALYTQLIAQGRPALSAALKAGAAIEEAEDANRRSLSAAISGRRHVSEHHRRHDWPARRRALDLKRTFITTGSDHSAWASYYSACVTGESFRAARGISRAAGCILGRARDSSRRSE